MDAFFTGCVTTTADAVFPPLSEVDRSDADLVAVIDLPQTAGRKVPQPHVTVTHHGLKYRNAGLVTGIRAAIGS